MDPPRSPLGGNNLPLAGSEAPATPEQTTDVPAQADGASENTAAPTSSQTGEAIDEGVAAMPLATSQLAPPTQDATEKGVTPRAAAPAVADSLVAAPGGPNDVPGANEQCNGAVNGAVNGLANSAAVDGEPLFARRRRGTGVCSSPSFILLFSKL
jgi:hypothetical protein